MKKAIVVLSVMSAIHITAQDQQLQQSNSNLILLNPSFAGTNGGTRVQTSVSTDALGYSDRPMTYQLAYDAAVKRLGGGIFASTTLFDLGNGAYVNNAYNLGYAYHLNLLANKLKIIPSIQGSYLYQKWDSNWSPIGTVLPARPLTKAAFDLSSGVLLQYRNVFSGGVSVFHINQPDNSLFSNAPLARKINLHAAYTFHFSDKRLLQVMALCSSQQYYQYFKLSGTLVINHFVAGLGIASTDPVSALIGYRHDLFTVQLGSTVIGSKLSGFYSNTWELHLSANIRNKEQRHVLTNIENW